MNSRKEVTVQGDRATERAIMSAARWLTRRGARREKRETQRAYRTASNRIRSLTR